MNASVSVIIPCFRCSLTIRRAVQSIVSQTLIPVEVILVDDGSGDGTLDVLHDLQREHGADWIKVFTNEKNCGPSTARNVAWASAVSDFVAFLDADDSWHPRKIEIQYNWMINNPSVLFTAHLSHVLEEGKGIPALPAQVISVY